MKKASLRTKKGLINLSLSNENDKITQVKITGDFFFHPEEALPSFEKGLVGVSLTKKALSEKITILYQEFELLTPGITVDDWVTVILKALKK
jgi:hypothetical protein